VTFSTPGDGAVVSGTVQITTRASDTLTSANITQKLYIDGALKTTVNGNTLNYLWSNKRVASGAHTLLVTATDNAGHSATSQVRVTR
jgi:thermitase